MLMEKMNHGMGPQKVFTSVGKPRFMTHAANAGNDPTDLMQVIRQKYPHYFTIPGKVSEFAKQYHNSH